MVSGYSSEAFSKLWESAKHGVALVDSQYKVYASNSLFRTGLRGCGLSIRSLADSTAIAEIKQLIDTCFQREESFLNRLTNFSLCKKRKQVFLSAFFLGEEDGVRLAIVQFACKRNTQDNIAFESLGLIGKNPKMKRLFSLIKRFSKIKSTVLISGETGTGKELVAKALHELTFESDRPFVVVNCSALSESLLESELFGHVKGAFSGATNDRAGRFELADNGTLFLDEIGDVSLKIQVKLLRFLDSKEYSRVGESYTRISNVRILAATNRDLRQMINDGEFREDLFYRLSVLEIGTTPLRQRKGDIGLLARHFLEQFEPPKHIAESVIEQLAKYSWPGNVRELKHAVERAYIFSDSDEILIEHFSKRYWQEEAVTRQFNNVRHLSKESILEAISSSNGCRTAAAKLLGISRATLYRKISEFEI